MKNPTVVSGIWMGQPLHMVCLTFLLVFVYFMWGILGEPSPLEFWCAVAFPVVHQIYVWLAWRLELKDATISKTIGFDGYLSVFFVLFSGRFVSQLILSWADRGSLGLSIVSILILTTLLAIPGIYAMYSVKKYFGMARAAGADHFDSRYRNMRLVKKGIFRFTDNGMYLYAFLLFWAIAVGFNSSAALVVTIFSHAYIWVHYYTTEKPDMNYLYNHGE